jgi:hypothetical protein
MDRTARTNLEIDDRFLSDWVCYGLRELDRYLGRHAEFDAWCESRRDGDAL